MDPTKEYNSIKIVHKPKQKRQNLIMVPTSTHELLQLKGVDHMMYNGGAAQNSVRSARDILDHRIKKNREKN